MKRVAIVLTALMLILLAPPARAESGAELVGPIAPFVDDQTIFVSQYDLTRLDVDSMAELAREIVDVIGEGETKKELTATTNLAAATAGAMLDRLRKGGVTQIYYIVGLDELLFSPGVLVVPMESPEKARAAIPLFAFLMDEKNRDANIFSHAEVVGSALLISDAAGLARAKSAKGKRPDIAEALEAAGDTPIKAALTPSPAMWKVAGELLPAMPRELGGGSTEELLKGIHCVALGIAPAMKPEKGIDEPATNFEFRIRIPADDEAAAKRAAKLIESLKTEIAKLPDFLPYEPFIKELFKVLTPKIDKAGLTINASKSDILKLASTFSRPAMRAREKSKTDVATAYAKQILLGVQIYQADHGNKWPATINELAGGEIKLSETLFVSPLDGKPFIYRQPTPTDLKLISLNELPVIWDAQGKDGLRVIGFGDGHVDARNEENFQEAFKKVGLKP